MSDERLRQLERRWKEAGLIADEAAWLRARVQAGEVSEEGVRLAAYLGQQAAREILGAEAPLQMKAASAYEATRTDYWLLIGFAEDFQVILENVSDTYLEECWERCLPLLRSVLGPGHGTFAYGGFGGSLYPDPNLDPSPIEGFGWVAKVDQGVDGLRDLGVALSELSAPKLFAATGHRRQFRSTEPLDHTGGVFALVEWCLDEPSEWTSQGANDREHRLPER